MQKYSINRQNFQKLRKPDAVIFDWDNTLVDTWPLIHQSINKTMEAMDKPVWSFQKVKDTVHKSMRESFPEIFGNSWQEAGDIYKKSYQEIHLDKICLLPNSLNLLDFLLQKNIKVFLVSNKIGSTLRKEVKKLNLEKYFFSIVGAHDADFDKPKADPVKLALMSSSISLEKNYIWFIGDTIADVECAHNCKVEPIIFGMGHNEVSITISSEILASGFCK
ncbi:MAG: HAD family hydrolase, partial [Alphaproteobacteria bacterium]